VIFVLEESAGVPFAMVRKSVIIRAGPFSPFSSLSIMPATPFSTILSKKKLLKTEIYPELPGGIFAESGLVLKLANSDKT